MVRQKLQWGAQKRCVVVIGSVFIYNCDGIAQTLPEREYIPLNLVVRVLVALVRLRRHILLLAVLEAFPVSLLTSLPYLDFDRQVEKDQ